ncbi:Chitin deacetylase [Psilocybe cubensis]|uniref:chitin deacetylase n=2 Tax=Psilocybe cubensis TaxID=181762 RepID=A0A8H8CQY3_PSICU|nr:Chitin deacetylase [Psilocybe cubensis]KAH9487079.1 Chitin deacetylase [Psilocybe cubensis]
MRLSTNTLLAVLPVFVAAHADHHLHARAQQHARQVPAAAPPPPVASAAGSSSQANVVGTTSSQVAASQSSSPAVAGTSTLPAGSSAASVAGTTSSVSSAAVPSLTVQLQATNPTAVPLASIIPGQVSAATHPLPSTAVAGSVPTFLSNAPPLPTITGLLAANYPPPDRPAPTDSPEVQQWIKEVQDTGVVIPQFSPTNGIGGCANNTAAASDASRCWWTCGGCTRSTDITECPTAMDWGLTYDDGPAFYTPNLLEYLDQEQLKATFFVVGSRVFYNWNMLQSQYMGQHQIAVHTWSHFPLTSLTNEQIIAELGWSRKIIKDVLGVTPNMMRPPYGDIDDRVRAISLAMGLTPVMWTRISPLATFDTDDFNIANGQTSVQQVIQNWENIIGNATTRNSGFIVLEHDLFEQSVEVATGYILPDALGHKNPPFKIQPVIHCLNKDMTDAYIETNNNKTNPPAFQAAVSAGIVTVTGTAAGAKSTGKSAAVTSKSTAGSLWSLAGLALGGLMTLP